MKVILVASAAYTVRDLVSQHRAIYRLTSDGVAQAHAVAIALKDAAIQRIVVTPETFTLNTVQELLTTLPVTPPLVTTSLLEQRDLGIFATRGEDAFMAHCQKTHCDLLRTRPSEGESIADLWERVSEFVQNLLCTRMREQTIVVCASPQVVTILCLLVTGKMFSDALATPLFTPGEIRNIVVDEHHVCPIKGH